METDNARARPKLRIWVPLIILVIGVVLMARQMYEDDEPGAIPLLLIAVGVGWLIIVRLRWRGAPKRARTGNR